MKNDHPNGQPTRSTVAESPTLDESLSRFRNQSPSESLGLPSGNNLAKPFLQAAVITAVLFALLTVGPYFYDKAKTVEAKGNAAPTADKADPGESPKKTPTITPGPENIAKVKSPTGKGDIVDKLGENGKKAAPLSVNPLDKKDDDLLRDIK